MPFYIYYSSRFAGLRNLHCQWSHAHIKGAEAMQCDDLKHLSCVRCLHPSWHPSKSFDMLPGSWSLRGTAQTPLPLEIELSYPKDTSEVHMSCLCIPVCRLPATLDVATHVQPLATCTCMYVINQHISLACAVGLALHLHVCLRGVPALACSASVPLVIATRLYTGHTSIITPSCARSIDLARSCSI